MKFGLFSSAQANSSDLGPETGQGFRDYLDFNVEAEALGFRSSFLVEHHFTGWNQVSSTLMLLMALGDAHQDLAARLCGHRAAMAQSGFAGRAGGDARSGLRRPVRFRHRQGLSAQRVQRFSDRAGRGRGAVRGSHRGDDAGLHEPGALSPTMAGSGTSKTSWSSRRRRKSHIRRYGSPPPASPRSAARLRAASI